LLARLIHQTLFLVQHNCCRLFFVSFPCLLSPRKSLFLHPLSTCSLPSHPPFTSRAAALSFPACRRKRQNIPLSSTGRTFIVLLISDKFPLTKHSSITLPRVPSRSASPSALNFFRAWASPSVCRHALEIPPGCSFCRLAAPIFVLGLDFNLQRSVAPPTLPSLRPSALSPLFDFRPLLSPPDLRFVSVLVAAA